MTCLKKKFKSLFIVLFAIIIVSSFATAGCGITENPPSYETESETPLPGGDDGKEENLPPEEEKDPPLWSQTYVLPKADKVKERLIEIYGGEEKLFLLQDRVLRMPCPQDGAYITFNFTYRINDYAKALFEDSVAEFNDVFAVINPNYKFKINYQPSEDDFKSPYSVRMNKVVSFTKPNTLGTAAMSTGGEYTGDFSIQIREDVLVDGGEILSVFKHETFHLLGAGDAYNNPNATQDTIMQGYSLNGCFSFSRSDVEFLDAMYRNPENPYGDKEISDYISKYVESNVRTYSVNEKAAYNKVLKGMTYESLREQVLAANYKNEDKNKVLSVLSEDWDFEESFGKSNVNFTELTPETEDETTVYYSGSFDVVSGKYWHGTRKYGSNLSSSMGIGYKDYGGGILFASPNGTANPTFFVKNGGYVFAFHRVGGFNSLDLLDVTLLRIYTL